MHKLYYVSYILISDGERDLFADDYLFTEDKPVKHLDSFGTFYELHDAVSSCKYPWCKGLHHSRCGRSILLHEPFVEFLGVSKDWTFAKANFKTPVSVETQYTECSAKYYNFDFFKKNLSADDFIIFLQEHGLIGGTLNETPWRLYFD